MRRLIFGCGYLGKRIAQAWYDQGDEVWVVTRSAERAGRLAAAGLRPLIGDVTSPGALPRLPAVETVLWSIGYDRQAGRTLEEVYIDGWRHVLGQLAHATGRVIYISSTGVYGDVDGSWVDERSLCQPRRLGGRACLAAEQSLLDSPCSPRAVVLRLAGIYGPHRLPRFRQLRRGEPLTSDPDSMINLIHVRDAASAVCRAADLPLPLPRTYLIADGHPVMRREFYEELARQTGTPPPQFAPATPGASGTDRSGSHKRVANTRMLRELGVQLRFPTFREGLAQIVRSSEAPDD